MVIPTPDPQSQVPDKPRWDKYTCERALAARALVDIPTRVAENATRMRGALGCKTLGADEG